MMHMDFEAIYVKFARHLLGTFYLSELLTIWTRCRISLCIPSTN